MELENICDDLNAIRDRIEVFDGCLMKKAKSIHDPTSLQTEIGGLFVGSKGVLYRVWDGAYRLLLKMQAGNY